VIAVPAYSYTHSGDKHPRIARRPRGSHGWELVAPRRQQAIHRSGARVNALAHSGGAQGDRTATAAPGGPR
jgi:hypothetical protein